LGQLPEELGAILDTVQRAINVAYSPRSVSCHGPSRSLLDRDVVLARGAYYDHRFIVANAKDLSKKIHGFTVGFFIEFILADANKTP
jgi:hypothetical protein